MLHLDTPFSEIVRGRFPFFAPLNTAKDSFEKPSSEGAPPSSGKSNDLNYDIPSLNSTEVVLSSHAVLSRNITSFPFLPELSAKRSEKLLSLIVSRVSTLPDLDGYSFFRLDNLTHAERLILSEWGILPSPEEENSPPALQAPLSLDKNLARGVILGPTRSHPISLVMNESDHLKFKADLPGFSLKKCLDQVSSLCLSLGENLPYAYSDSLGYLTESLHKTGTGLRLSVLLHLPGLALNNDLEKVVRACHEINLKLETPFDRGASPSTHLFLLSNDFTLGASSDEILSFISDITEEIIRQEIYARKKLMEHPEQSLILKDHIGRAFGTLRYAGALSYSESIHLLSLLKFGFDLDFLGATSPIDWKSFFLAASLGHLLFMQDQRHPQSVQESKPQIARTTKLLFPGEERERARLIAEITSKLTLFSS